MPRTKKEKPAPEPDDVVRQAAGAYRSGDGRFDIQQSGLGWYLVDTEQANEFGQQLIHGPFATLAAVREAIPSARDVKPLLRVRPSKQKPPTGKQQPAARPPAAPPPSWIDRLPEKEAAEVRRLVRALEREGLPDAEQLVRRHRGAATPEIAALLIERWLNEVVDDQGEQERGKAREIVRRVVEILARDGSSVTRPAPGWALIEVGPDDAPPKRPIRPRV